MSAQQRAHEAIQGLLDEGELALAWTLTIDVAGPDRRRYLAHRAGGGADGADRPMAWAALGMLRTSANVAEDQLRDTTHDEDEGEPDGL
jgi:hypothetical protein